MLISVTTEATSGSLLLKASYTTEVVDWLPAASGLPKSVCGLFKVCGVMPVGCDGGNTSAIGSGL